MAKTNLKTPTTPLFTHEGARASQTTAKQQLRRSLMSCMLWENEFYEDGQAIAERIASLIPNVAPGEVAAMVIEARSRMKLRHVPLLVLREMARLPKHRALVATTLPLVIQRADELAEFMAIYWKDGRQPISGQVKKGLAAAFQKFDGYALAKYNRDAAVKLRDVLFLVHAKPKDNDQAALWRSLIDGKLEAPDTWEVALSGGKDKKETWERLMSERKLGGLAFLRNLRNMEAAGVAKSVVSEYMATVNFRMVLPFRFIAAARAVPQWEDVVEKGFLRCLAAQPKLPGKTVLVVDVSGSMYAAGNISAKSDITRVQAAGALAAICRELCEDVSIYATAGNDSTRVHATAAVPARHGFALSDMFGNRGFASTLGGGGIFLTQCLAFVKDREKVADRVIVLTDEQDCDLKLTPDTADAFGKRNYLINVASAANGIGYRKFTHIDGWSEAILDYIREVEGAVPQNTSNAPAEDAEE